MLNRKADESRRIQVTLMLLILATVTCVIGFTQERFSDSPQQNIPKEDRSDIDIPGGVTRNSTARSPAFNHWSCARCHCASGPPAPIPGEFNVPQEWVLGNEYKTWGQLSPHASTYQVLKNQRSKYMAKSLRIVDPVTGESLIHRDARCLACHTGLPFSEFEFAENGLVSEQVTESVHVKSGVNCEGCHGQSGDNEKWPNEKGWELAHVNNPGWRYLSPEEKSKKFGFYNLRSPISRTRLCVSCHIGNAKEGRVITHEMYAAGHPPLPAFELESFSHQLPRHWQDFRFKPKAAREDWLKKTQTVRSEDHYESYKVHAERPLEDSRDLIVAAYVSLSEFLKLTANLADATYVLPHQIQNSSSHWPQLAQFQCSSCHHDPTIEENNRPLGSSKGRPMLVNWPMELVKLAIRNTDIQPAVQEEVQELLREIQQIMQKEPFGDPKPLVEAARKLAVKLDFLADSVQRNPFQIARGQQLLNDILKTGQNSELDYDSARQLTWAFRVIYDEIYGTPPSTQEGYHLKNPEQLLGWYSEKNETEVEMTLKSFEELLLLDLRKGRLFTKLPFEPHGGYFEWRPKKSLDPMIHYRPRKFQERMTVLGESLAKQHPN